MAIEFTLKSLLQTSFLDKWFSIYLFACRMPTLKNVIVIDDAEEIVPSKVTRFSDLMNMGQTDQSLKELLGDNVTQFDDVINIQFTSGTTGSPKGSMLTHHNIVQNVKFSSEQMFKDYLPPNGKEPVICVPNPLYHCFGSITGSATSVYVNGTMVLPAPIFNAKSTLSAIEKYRSVPFKPFPSYKQTFLDATLSLALRPCGPT